MTRRHTRAGGGGGEGLGRCKQQTGPGIIEVLQGSAQITASWSQCNMTPPCSCASHQPARTTCSAPATLAGRVRPLATHLFSSALYSLVLVTLASTLLPSCSPGLSLGSTWGRVCWARKAATSSAFSFRAFCWRWLMVAVKLGLASARHTLSTKRCRAIWRWSLPQAEAPMSRPSLSNPANMSRSSALPR